MDSLCWVVHGTSSEYLHKEVPTDFNPGCREVNFKKTGHLDRKKSSKFSCLQDKQMLADVSN